MMRLLRRVALYAAIACLPASLAFAQGGSTTTSLAGVVVDKDGGVIPGATIVVKNNATGVSNTTVTNGEGVWSFPAMEPGMYTVTISLEGFKTLTVTDVRLLAATPGNLRNTLEVGALSDQMTVKAKTELIRTQSPTVSSTVSGEFIKSVPRNDRNALSFMIFLPGVETSGGAQNSRGSTISGLPQNTINITIDGVSTSNNLQSGDGFFSMVTPRLDAVEEVTLTTAASGADSAAQGATQVRFVTKSGTNVYKGTAYEYFRHKSLNTNSFFNRLNGLGKPRNTVDQYGASLGGPIVIKGLFDGHGRAFFFVNWEEQWTPNQASRSRTVALPHALSGDFKYNLVNPTTVNVLDLAAKSGFSNISAQDPTVKALLAAIDEASRSTGTLTASSSNLNTQSFNYFVNVASLRHNPTESVDINLSAKHHLKGSYYLQRYKDDPDTLNNAESTFPGFPAHAHQNSYRTTGSISERATFSSNLVNEILGGWQSSPNDFFGDSSPSMFVNQGGFVLGLGSIGSTLTNASPNNANGPQPRNTINWNIDDNVSWLKGNHNFRFGGSFTRIDNHIESWNSVPTITFGFNTTNDPAASMFNTTNFPGATSGDLNNARQLYALLTGRVSSVAGTARLNADGTEFVYLGHLIQAERMDEWGFYGQDSWRWKPNVTLSYGVRYELQMPFVPTKSTRSMSTVEDLCGPSGVGGNTVGGRFCNLYNPGVLLNPGQVPTYTAYNANSPGYNTDYNNFAPNVGVAYRPNIKSGIGRAIMGDPEQGTISAGFSRSFNRERVDRFTAVFGSNPGPTTPATRSTAATAFCLVCTGESWPILFSQKDRLGPPEFKKTPTYPITADITAGNDIAIFDPKIQLGYTDSWTMGVQRSLGRDMAVEVRYIGNMNKKAWAQENWNGANWIENGLLDEYRVAQANLKANVAAGRGGTFAYFGDGSGTKPLPIFLAAFSASKDSGNASAYTSTQFTNSTWIDDLDPYAPGPDGIASNLWTGNSGSWRTNLKNAGYPANFLVMNPLVDSASVMRNLGQSKYNSMQVDLRRRFSQGLQVQMSYTYARGVSFSNVDLHLPLLQRRNTNIPHAIKLLWVYDLPFGSGRRFGADWNKWVNGALGGWQFSGSGRIQQPIFRLTNAQLVGMSHAEAQEAFSHIRVEVDSITGATTVWDMPQDIIDNTRKAYNTDPTTVTGFADNDLPTGRYFAPACGPEKYGLNALDCSPDLFFKGRWFGEFDFKLTKRFPLGFKKAVFDFDVEVFNALYAKNFSQTIAASLQSSNTNVFRITGTQSNARTGQLVWRVSW